MDQFMAYISGALTDMPEARRALLRRLYEDIGECCQMFGLEPYLPHVYGDPVRMADKTPQEIDRIDRQAVTLCYLLVAYVGESSTGVGIEIEMAYHANKPVVLLCEQTKLDARLISRLVRGNPAVKAVIAFTNYEDALMQLKSFLRDFCLKIREEQLPPPLSLESAPVK